MDLKSVGKFIAEKREEKKLTQAELAELAGVTVETVMSWEKGEEMPEPDTDNPLYGALGITMFDLLSIGQNCFEGIIF